MVQRGAEERRITAVLGPTNTGKTHLAVEHMLSYRTGLMGFPLRLLAREVYDKVVELKGPDVVALVTGEEKLVPPRARYFLCTVEAMPTDVRVDFLAVDEVQLAADRERGHVFTDRLLNARGAVETMFLGADTIRMRLKDLAPDAAVISRPRFSELSYAGHKKLTRLKPRTAVIAFSAQEVYALAEVMRTHRGGCAVVLGALSPRTRNAQVGMYQAGEIDYLVATDAIGMGLNMDLDHVAFSADVKFDGHRPRRLRSDELAQIAGRAGRHLRDGTFGTTADLRPFDQDMVEALENHRFASLKELFWRNANLSYRSVGALLKSLDAPPQMPGLRRVRGAVDHLTLQALARDPEVADIATSPDMVRLLWQVCQIPDFRKTLADAHIRLARDVFLYLARQHRLPNDWVGRLIARLEHTDGDIDTLTTRISHTRTWTYISHHADWLDDPVRWQERTREIEDKLSDALHERLTQRFVDRRAAVLVRRLRESDELFASISRDGEVMVEGHFVGSLKGFRFEADRESAGDRAVLSAAHRVLAGEMARRAARIEADPDSCFALGAEAAQGGGPKPPDALVYWNGEPVARLAKGESVLNPGLQLLDAEQLSGPQRERVRRRLAKWLAGRLARFAAPLARIQNGGLRGAARGVAYQLWESLGCVSRQDVDHQIAALEREERQRLRDLGVRLGTLSVFVPAMLRVSRTTLSATLWAVSRESERVPSLPNPAAVSFPAEPAVPRGFYGALGFTVLGPLALRADIAERLAASLRRRARGGPFAVDRSLLALAGCKRESFAALLEALGYEPAENGTDGIARYVRAPSAAKRRPKGGHKARSSKVDPNSPFAKLRGLNSRPT